MTLIAFATYGDQAEIITDTSSYRPAAQAFGHCSKVTPLPHLDAALITQGDAAFGHMARHMLAVIADDSPDHDRLLAHAHEGIEVAWQWAQDNAEGAPVTASAVFLLGYSPAAFGFVAHAYSSHDGFTRHELTGQLHIMPTPFALRISDIEAAQLIGWANPDDLATLKARPAGTPPTDLEGWVDLALAARRDRAAAPVESRLKTFVGGSVHHTRLTRGQVTTRTVHTFDDSGEEFRRMVAGTLHPMAQLGPCPCGNDARYLDCCLREHLDRPCLCQSGRTLASCCAVTVDQATAVTSTT